ncbi:MAG: hypothetical protein R2724_03925 [Bryobacterales bacterium]
MAVSVERATVFQARGVSKVYEMGEVRVHALRGVDLDLFEGELIVLLGPPAAVSRLCSTFSGGSIRRRAGPSATAMLTSPGPPSAI